MRKILTLLGFMVIALFIYPAHPNKCSDQEELIVAAHYPAWYQGNWVWYKGSTPFYTAYTPLLGHYNNKHKNTLSQHIEWARQYGLNTFMIEWCGIANSTYWASHEEIVSTFKSNPDFKKINFFFVYSIIMGLRKAGDDTFDPVDFDDQQNVNKLISDFKYAAAKYFNQTNHLKINGKPVIYIWAVGLAEGDFKSAIETLRNTIKNQYGMDLYIIADEVGWNSSPVYTRTPLFDAVMPYAMVKAEGQPPTNYALEDSIDEIIPQYANWYFACDDMGIDFIPGVIPGFNPTGAPWCYNDNFEPTVPTIERSPESFKDFIVKAKSYIDPDANMFYITSWSEWNEGTNIEPSVEFQFDYLQALKEALAEESPITPPGNVIKFSFKKIFDPDGPDNRLLAVAFDTIEFLDSAQNILQTIDIGTSEAREYMGLGWFSNEGPWASDAENFAWAGTEWKYATLHLDLPPDTVYMRLRIVVPEGQETSIFLDSENKATISGSPWVWQSHLVLLNPSNLPPQIQLNHSNLAFGASTSGAVTGPQNFLVNNSGGGILNWTISDDQTWLSCSPTSGTNAGSVSVSADPSGLVVGKHSAAITVTDPNASNSPQTISVTLTIYGAGAASKPFGDYATPTNGSTVSSSVPFTGWVLDDIGVESVKLYRKNGQQLTYIGAAVFVEGARPDIEQSYPDYPMNYKAGWGYMMLTNFLPNGNGGFTIHAIATDLEGHQVTLGTKTITVDNANAVKPFGAIDTPAQGGTANGSSFRNHGWVLTPIPNSIPTDGSTINVYINGVYLGHPFYNIYRSDIAALFPGYANSNGAGAYFDINTTVYENGVHSIYWTAADNVGNTDGIGSRYFTIQNTGSGSSQAVKTQASSCNLPGIAELPVLTEPIGFKIGFNEKIGYSNISPDENGIIRIELRELERLELHISNIESGFMLAGNKFHPLPIGSTLDTGTGTFSWIPGPGFYGNYRLVFIKKGPEGELSKKEIHLRIVPKFGTGG
jgi:hypothetical protein